MIFRKVLYAAATLTVGFLAVLLLVYEPCASEAVRDTLGLFFHRVLPPLFPYMVISRLMISFDLLAPLGRQMRLNRLFRLPSCAASVVLTGLLCGFPVGAAGACALHEQGRISSGAAGRLTALSSNASPAFLFGTVAALWNSRQYGGFLWGVQTISAVWIACIAARLCRNEEIPKEETPRSSAGTFPEELCRAVSESASGCLCVCAYIVFFRVTAVLLSRLIPPLAPVFSVLSEFSTGCADGASVGGYTGIFMTGFAAGSAGLSVMMQNYNFIGRRGIPAKTLWITKAIQGIVCGTASVLFYRIHPLIPAESTAVSGLFFSWNAGILTLAVLLLLSKIYKISKHGI